MKLLFTNAGRRTYLIEYAIELQKLNYDIEIFVCDTSVDTAAMHVSSEVNWFITPRVTENEHDYLNELLDKCTRNKIEMIVPLMDYELLTLAKHRKEFEETGIKLWLSDYEVIDICLDKRKNFEFCMNNGIPVPETWFFAKKLNTPVIKKKIFGSGSNGIEVIKPGYDYTFHENRDMIQSIIDGKEYGMDILNDYNGKYVHACIKEKISMRSGETDKAKVISDSLLEELAVKISSIFKHRGSMDIDFIKTNNNDVYFLDFNPRFGGGYPFTHASGANYLKYIVDISMGNPPEIPRIENYITGMKGLNLFYYENRS